MTQRAKYAPGGRRPARPGRQRRPLASSPNRIRLAPGRGGLLGALLLAVLLLTGCVTVQLNATVHPDGTLSGTARYGVAKSLAAVSGGQQQLLAELKQARTCDFGTHHGTTKDFDDGTYIGIACTFDHVTMAEFNSDPDRLRLTKDGDEFHLAGSLSLLDLVAGGNSGGLGLGSGGVPAPSGFPSDLTSLLPSGFPSDLTSLLPSGFPSDLTSLLPSGFPSDLTSLLPSDLPTQGLSQPALSGLDPSTVLKTAKVSLAFTFPGKVKSSKGKIDGRKVTFTPDSAGNIDFQTTASAVPESSTGPGTATWLVLAAVLLALLAAAGLLVRRRRAQRAAPTDGYPGGYPPGYPAGTQYQAQGYPAGTQYPAQGYPPQPYQPYQPTQEYPTAPPYPPSQPYPHGGPYPPESPYTQGNPYPPTQPYPPGPPYQPSPWAAPQEQPSPWARPDAEPDADPAQPWPRPENDSGKS